MTKKLTKDALLSDLAAVEAMLASLPEDDFIARVGFEARKAAVKEELATLAGSRETLANVALVFHGKPVRGSRSISAEFAAKALNGYQDLVAKRLAASDGGGLALRGPAPAKQAASLNICGVVHGSFGFVLEEGDPDSPQLINSSLREAVERVTDVLEHFTAESDTTFSDAINEMDPKLFTSVKSFFKILHEDEATLRIVEGEKDRCFDSAAVDRAYQRCQEASIDEDTLTVTGTLIGVIPYGRRFELKTSEGEVIKGKVGPLFSQGYIERIENDEQMIGRRCQVKLMKKSVERPGQKTLTSYTLLGLDLSLE